jgi:hypothetical protein
MPTVPTVNTTTETVYTPEYLAAWAYLRRQGREYHPSGRWDRAGRWYPDDATEWRKCCDAVRPPSRRWPYSYLDHCRTAVHVASLYNADVTAVRRIARQIKVLNRLASLSAR